MLARAFALALLLTPAAALAGPDPACGPHEHVVAERDEDEGSTVKRCVCDEGYQSEGPGKPCKPVAGGKAGKGGDAAKPGKGAK